MARALSKVLMTSRWKLMEPEEMNLLIVSVSGGWLPLTSVQIEASCGAYWLKVVNVLLVELLSHSNETSGKTSSIQARASDAASKEDSGFWIGIAHLLTPASALGVQACRRRCLHAVLSEQAIQEPSAIASSRSEDIALASSAETRKAVLRARKLGKLHQYSICEYTGNILKDLVDYTYIGWLYFGYVGVCYHNDH